MNLGFDINDWNEAEAKEFGEYESLTLGGHEVIIKNAGLYTGQTGNTSLKVEVDIAGDDKQAGFYQKQYDENNNADKRWPSGATKYLSLKRENLGYTKGFVKALENSNKGFELDPPKGWEQLNGLKCVGVFGLEEYEGNDGNVRTSTKLQNFRSLDKLSEVKIPRVKLLNGGTMEYDEYINNRNNNKPENVFSDDTVQIDDTFLD